MGTKHHPTPEERDERVKVDLDPATFVQGVLAAGPQDEDEPKDDERDGLFLLR
ncbi:MAG TPA: hypothetical protein VGB14_13850 [Acidimicrobiales bacterium]